MLKLNPQSRILQHSPSYITSFNERSEIDIMSKREEIMAKWKDYIVDMTQSVENMNGKLIMLTDITLLLQPVIVKLGVHDMETIYEEFGSFEIRYDYGVAKMEIHLKENIIHEQN